MNVNVMMQYVTYGLALIGVLAFLVSIIVQVIKELPGLNKIPTSIVALVTSLILCPVALAVLCTYYKTAVTWYYIFASDYCGVCSVFGCDRRLGKSKRYLGQDEIQRFRGRVIPL